MIENITTREILTLIIISYFIGSIPTAYILTRIVKKIDIRNYGSGNVGATNVFRVLGKGFGTLTLIIDILKGSLAIFATDKLLSINNLHINDNHIAWAYLCSGVFAFLGHIFSVWLKFKGGKGVAVAAGVFLYIAPFEWLIALAIFIIIVAITRYVSAGSLIALASFTLLIYLNIFDNPWNMYKVYFIAALFVAIGVIISHRQNISRIIEGKENKIFSKKNDT